MKGTQREIPSRLAAVLVAACAARASLDAGLWSFPSRPSAGIAWRPLAEARAIAEREDMPLLVDVTADWCAPCVRMDAETWTDDQVIDLVGRRFVAARVVQSSDPGVATPGEAEDRAELGVEAFPTLIVFVPGTGRPLRSTGLLSAGETRRLLERALLQHLAARNARRRAEISAPGPPASPTR